MTRGADAMPPLIRDCSTEPRRTLAMTIPATSCETPGGDGKSNCLVRSVTTAFVDEPALEAVRFNHAQKSISVATIGRANNQAIEHRLTDTIKELAHVTSGPHCALLEGAHDCSNCTIGPAESGQTKLTVQHNPEVTIIARVTCPTAPSLWRWHTIPWPKIVPRTVSLPDEEHHEDEWKEQLVAAVLCGVFGLVGYFMQGTGAWAAWSVGAYVAAYLAGAWFTVHEVWERLQKSTIDVHFLMLAVAAGAATIGAWGEGTMLLFLFSLSGALEHYAMGRTQREIRSLFRDAPKTARVLDAEGHEQETPVEQLQTGMRLLIKPGDQFPVDAEVAKGATSADESNLTGEATPVEKTVGDTLLAGTMNVSGAVEAVVLRPAAQSALQKIIHLIHEAQHLKAPSQRFTDKFGTTYTWIILGLTIAMFLVWWLGFGQPAFTKDKEGHSAFYHAMTLLVVASPCALVLSIPSAVLAAIAWAARRGILFRGGAAVENLAQINVVAMDKTGTLTTGELQVERIESFPPGREAEVASLVYSLERLSTHPLARAITRYGKQNQIATLEVTGLESVTGSGLRAQRAGQTLLLGRREWIAQVHPSEAIAQAPHTEAGFGEMWLAAGDLLGRVVLRDDVRPQSREVVLQLRKLGLHTVVLTGDRRATAEALREQLSLDDVRAELNPQQKVEAITSFTRAGRRVAMIGDGVNDAPSLAAADVGVAMGARGSDAALEQAEVVLMHDRIENFLAAFRLSQRARSIIKQNVFISLGTVVVLVTFAMFGKIPLTLGVLGHEGSTVIVVMNSLRLLLARSGRA